MKRIEVRMEDVVAEYFKARPNKIIPVSVAEGVIREIYKELTGVARRDPARVIRYLAGTGFIQRVKKGYYLYDPENTTGITHHTTTSQSQQPKKTYLLNRLVIEDCLEKAKAHNDTNAEKCFRKMLDTMNKHSIEIY